MHITFVLAFTRARAPWCQRGPSVRCNRNTPTNVAMIGCAHSVGHAISSLSLILPICLYNNFNLLASSIPSVLTITTTFTSTSTITTVSDIMNNNLPLQPVFVCAHCSRTQRLGARWGAGTTDAAARLFCTFECAWMTLLIDEHRANYAAAAAAAATTTTTAAQPTQMASRSRYPVGRRTRRRSTTNPKPSKSSAASNASTPAPSRLQQQCMPSDDGNWHAMLGMAALFGEH